MRRSRVLLARVSSDFLSSIHDLGQVVARRILHRRVLLVGLELLQPQRLADGQHVPVVDDRRSTVRQMAPPIPMRVLYC